MFKNTFDNSLADYVQFILLLFEHQFSVRKVKRVLVAELDVENDTQSPAISLVWGVGRLAYDLRR